MPRYQNILATLLLMLALVYSFQFMQQVKINRAYKIDRAELNHIHYGLLNANQWSHKLSNILVTKINAFDFNLQKSQQMRVLIEKTLTLLFEEAETKIRDRNVNNKQGWEFITGGIRQLIIENLVGLDELKQDIPAFADKLLLELEKPAQKQRLIMAVKQQLTNFTQQTFSQVDLKPYLFILKKYNCQQRLACNSSLTKKIQALDAQIQQFLIFIISCLFGVNLLLLQNKMALTPYVLGLLLSSCLLLLGLGISTPMLEIEAKITQLAFQLMNEPIVFTEQFIYYQHKSILDVVELLLKQAQYEVVLVGVLILIFSVLFPVLKLISSALYYQNPLKTLPLIKFFALKSGKWSMADVWVIAIFMAYIGFDSLLVGQLAQLEQTSSQIKILTMNGSQLQAGFYLFLGFCLSSLLVSMRLEQHAVTIQT